MSLEQMYHNRRAQIIERAIETLVKPHATPDKIDSDGKSQLKVARQDEPRLTAEGMDPILITDVEETLGAYTWVSSLVDMKIAEQVEDSEIYKNLKGRAYDLRRVIVKYAKFGCVKHDLPREREKLDDIIAGSGDEDLIRDMLLLHQLLTLSPTITAGLPGFNPAWIEESMAIHTELGDLRAQVKNPDVASEIAALELEERQAFDLYHHKVTELRQWGQFVFEGEERASEYRAEYFQERAKKGWATRNSSEEDELSL